MKKFTVYEIVKEIETDYGKTSQSIGIPAFKNSSDACEFLRRCGSAKFPSYQKFAVNPEIWSLTYQPKEIEVVESIEEFDQLLKHQNNKAREEEIAKKKAEIEQLKDEME